MIIAALLLAALLPATAYADGTRRHHVEPPLETQEAPQTLNAYDGVYEFGGRLETYYSSDVLYHYRTDEWEVDENGFYRTAEGYFVVAASDMPEGTVFMGSMGPCQVLDSGCDAGVTDYYVKGW